MPGADDQPSYATAPPRLIAGARGLDLVNTVEWRGDPGARGERLTGYGELVLWCVEAGLISTARRRRLMAAAARAPEEAAAVLRAARALRDDLATLIEQPAARATASRRIDRLFRGLRYRPAVETEPTGRVHPRFEPAGAALALPLEAIALEVAALIGSGQLDAVRRCGNPRCGWLYLDASRNRARRWCSMASCGNQAKARAHHARRRARRADG